MLYIVGTPIGNLDDLSIRQAKTLSSSDVILAEDTRSAVILLQAIVKKFNLAIKTGQRLISYYKEREFEKLPEILNFLESGKVVSLISESGMPLISDPGQLLVREAVKRSIKFEAIPGPTAVMAALVYSGFKIKNFLFLGYLPKKELEIKTAIGRLIEIRKILKDVLFVFYESPKRINKTLEIMDKLIPSADICICRELTKKFEETIRGKPSELLKRQFKGEITVVF